MSGSSAFANYSNTIQGLANSTQQAKPTTTQVTNDAANFEQQFLIQVAYGAKMKAGDKLLGLFKKSKKIEALRGQTEDQLRRLAQSGQDSAAKFSKKIVSKVKGVAESTESSIANTAKAVEGPDLNLLRKLRGKAKSKLNQFKDGTSKARDTLAEAETDVETETAKNVAAKAAEGVAKKAAVDAGMSGGTGADATAAGKAATKQGERLAEKTALRDQAKTALSDSEGRQFISQSDYARADNDVQQGKAYIQSVQGTKAATTAGTQGTGGAADDAATAAAKAAAAAPDDAAAAAAAKAAREAKEAKDALTATKDVEEGAAAESEADPLGLVVAGIAAIATQFIGRKIKAHENEVTAPPAAPSYSQTLGA